MMSKFCGHILLGLAFAFPATGVVAAENYKIDPSHSFVMFKISHLGFSVLHGRFNELSGDFTYDPDDPANSRIRVEVKTASVDSNWAERDKHLRGSDFLDVDRYPTATFETTSFSMDGDSGTLKGDLTLHGTTRPITVAVEQVGAGKDPWGGFRRGFTGMTEIRRSDFGIDYNLGPQAEVMELHFVIEGVRE